MISAVEGKKVAVWKDTRDMRDPTAIGELLLKRPKSADLITLADHLDAYKIPKYKG